MEPRSYRNFTLRVSPVKRRPGRYVVKIFGLIPGGQPTSDEQEIMSYDPAAFVTGNLNLLGAIQFGQMTVNQLYALGNVLADMLLVGSIRKRWWDSLNVVRERRLGLRLRLLLEAPELIDLPWEFLYLRPPWENADSELYFLALQPDISIVRHEVLDIAEPSLAPQISYRMVAAQASPADQPELALDAERKAIETVIAKLPLAGLLQPTWIEKTTRRKLRNALRIPSDILHFSGHGRMVGKVGQIILENNEGKSEPYAATYLASLIQASPMRLAILNACETGMRSGNNPWSGIASALVRVGVAAVVSCQYPILDISSTPLAEEIYLGVLKGLTIDEAVSNARRAIYQENGLQNPDWGALVLSLRAEEGIIFPSVPSLVRPQPAIPQPDSQQIIKEAKTGNKPVTGNVAGANAAAIDTQFTTPTIREVSGVPIRAIPHILPPRQEGPLFGRDEVLNQALKCLEGGGKVYFYGTYGVGKTSLAAELYRRLMESKAYSDGCLWDRVSNSNIEKVLDRVASKFASTQVAQAEGREEKIQALTDLLAGRKDLLIALDEVDNRDIVKIFLEVAGDCTLIFNGAQRLNLALAAIEHRLKPLEPQEAGEMFKMLARPRNTVFSDEEAVVVAKICWRMRYLPLAIKLAALKFAEGIESLQELYDRIKSEPDSLSPDDGVAVIFAEHHSALKRMPTALNLLIRIASFPALEAPLKALQVGHADFYSSKDKLLDLGLVDSTAPERIALHPLLGNQVQRAEPEVFKIERERAAIWLADYAAHNRKDNNALEREQTNLLALLDYYACECRWNDVVSLLHDLFDYLRVRGYWQEALEHLNAVIVAGGQVIGPRNLAEVHLQRGIIHLLRANYELAKADFELADRIYARINDQVHQGIVQYQFGRLLGMKGDLQSAHKHLETALELMGKEGPQRERISALSQIAGIFAIQGNMDQSKKYYDLALSLSQSSGEIEDEMRIHLALGILARKGGDLPDAQTHLDRASELAKQLGDLLHLALIQQELGHFHYYQGSYDKAETAFNEALDIFQHLKYPLGLAEALHALGNLALAHQKYDDAKQQYAEALKINEALGHKDATAYNQYQLGVVASRVGLFDQAEVYYKKVLDAVQDEKLNDIALQAATWFQLSKLALTQNDSKLAKQYTRRAKKLAEQAKYRFTEGAALYQMSMMQAQEGQIEAARDTMSLANAAFVALNAPEAEEAKKALEAMEASKKDVQVKIKPRKDLDVIVDRSSCKLIGGNFDFL